MKRYLTLAVASLVLTTGACFASPEVDTLQPKTKAFWQAFQEKKADDFKKMCAPNYTAVYAEGIATVAQDLDMMKEINLTSFDMRGAKVAAVDADTAFVTYTMKVSGTMNGHDISGDLNCGTVWHKNGSDWQVVLHTEIKAESPASK